MKALVVVTVLLFSYQVDARGPVCSTLFENFEIVTNRPKTESKFEPKFVNGHNESLRMVMVRMRDFEAEIRQFVDGLTPKLESKYFTAKDYRNTESLEKIIDIAVKYEKILNHLVLHSKDLMMTSRIEMIPAEKRAEFLERYQQAYIDYLEGFSQLRLELESYRNQNPKEWNNRKAQDILMHLHSIMGESHNKF